jgi:hypothetical protein
VKRSLIPAVTIILSLLASVAPAQTLQVSGNGIIIQDGDTTPDRFQATLFPAPRAVGSADSAATIFGLRNASNSTTLTISSVTISGPDAGTFSPFVIFGNTIGPGQTGGLALLISGPVNAEKNATVNINSNDPAHAVYNFAVRAPASLPAGPVTDVGFGAEGSTAIAKRDSKTGHWSLKLKTTFMNAGDSPSVGGSYYLFGTTNYWATTNSPLLANPTFKAIKARKSDDVPPARRRVKAKIKDITLDLSAIDYVFVLIDNPSDAERDFSNQGFAIPITVK